MTTVIRPAKREKTWDEIFEISESTPEGYKQIANSVLMITAAHLGTSGKQTTYVHKSMQKRLYGKILWNYLGDTAPSLTPKDLSVELGHLLFAYYLRKALEANPVVTREYVNAIPA